jgi:hypothetical protein
MGSRGSSKSPEKKSGPEVQIYLGWPANPTKSGPKKKKRGLVSNLDSLNLELFAKVFAKKSKKNPKIELRQPPTNRILSGQKERLHY